METDDAELLRAFVREGSQAAFAVLVRKYAGLLYHAALRLTGRADLAEEAAQNALGILARKAGSLRNSASIAPWLHRTVCFEAAKLRRRERRYSDGMNHLTDPSLALSGHDMPEDWKRVTPHLDEALDELPEADRRVVLLKYFEDWDCEEMARRLGGQSAAWRQRLSRAMTRLRKLLARRGVVVPVTVLAGGLHSTLSHAAPSAVAASLTTTPLVTAGTVTWKTLALHSLHFMNTKQLVSTVIVIAAAVVPLSFQAAAVSRAEARVAGLESTAKGLQIAAGANLSGDNVLARAVSKRPAGSSAKEDAVDAAGIDVQDLARVLAEGPNGNLARMVQYRLALSRLDAAGLQKLLSAAETLDLPPGHRYALYERLLPSLASKDPVAAVTTGVRLAGEMSGKEAVRLWRNPLPNCLADWAAKDPGAARAWFEAQKRSGALEVKSLGNADLATWLAGGVFTGMMRGDMQKEGLAFFESLDDAGRGNALLRFGTSNSNSEDHATIVRLAAGISDSEARSGALMGVANTLGKSDLAAAGTLIAKAELPAAETRKLLVAAALAPAGERGFDPAARLTWLRAQTPPEQMDKSIGYFMGSTAGGDLSAVKQQVDKELAAGATDAFLGAFIRSAAERSNTIDLAFSYFPRLSDPAERARTLREMHGLHPEAAMAAARQAGVSTAEMDAALQSR
ncbi:MAG TPA: sigma-70 family RNA polymerase sigma factor [Verrucomicrobiales bacterium]|nr:sigma-70 family RNA polymerase sigma factor [Verrucomicrobiales bacterium]